MRLSRYFAVIVLLTGLCRLGLAADTAPADKPPVGPMEKVLADVDFHDVALEEIIDFLQNASPGFKAVVVREGDVPDSYPRVKMKLKNVTIAQVWMVLQASYPDLEFQQIGQGDVAVPIWLVRVKAPASGATPAFTPAAVRVYRLAPVVRAMSAKVGKEDVPKIGALDPVLSLIKATLAQVPGGTEPVLQVHEETQTLIFKGSAEQKAALELVLAVLDPSAAPELAELRQHESELGEKLVRARDQYTLRVQQLEAELAEARQKLADEEKNSLEVSRESEKLKVRLEIQGEQLEALQKRKDVHERREAETRPSPAAP